MPVETAQTVKLKAFEPSSTQSPPEHAKGVHIPGEAHRRVGYLQRAAVLMQAVVRRPGLDGDEREKAETLRTLIGSMRRSTDKLVDVLGTGIENRSWLRALVEAQVAELVGEHWQATGVADVDPEIDALIANFPDISDLFTFVQQGLIEPFNEGAVRAGMQMAVVRASAPVLVAVLDKAGVENAEAIFFPLQDTLLERVLQIPLADGMAIDERVQIVQTVLGAGGRLMATTFARCVESGDGEMASVVEKTIADWQHAMDAMDRMVAVQLEKTTELVLGAQAQRGGPSL